MYKTSLDKKSKLLQNKVEIINKRSSVPQIIAYVIAEQNNVMIYSWDFVKI